MPSSAVPVNQLRTGGQERARYVGWFRPNGASNPTDFYFPGGWATVVREGAGSFFLFLTPGVAGTQQNASSRRIVGQGAELAFNGATGNRAYVGDGPNNNNTYRIHVVDVAGAHIQLPADAVTRVTVWIEVEEK